MSNCLVLNSTNSVGSTNTTFTYNFVRGSYTIKEGAEICISNITIPYSFYNVSQAYYNNTKFSYTWSNGSTYTVTLPDGFYTVDDINNYLQNYMISQSHYLIDSAGNYVYYLLLTYDPSYYAINLLSFAVPTSLPSGFSQPVGWPGYPATATTPLFNVLASSVSNFGQIIGFTQGSYPSVAQSTNYSTLSNTVPVGSNVNSIVVRCNIVDNNVVSPGDIIDSFPITSSFGSNINYVPHYEKWVKLKPGSYSSFALSFVDQSLRQFPCLDNNVLITLLIRQPPLSSTGK